MKLASSEIRRLLLKKMARKNLWGGKHTAFGNLWKKGIPPEHWNEFKKELERLIREGIVVQKPTGYGLHVSLNVRMKAEIEKIILG